MSCFFDTNVLVSVLDRAEPVEQAVAQDLVSAHMAARDLVLGAQVLTELYVLYSEDFQNGTRLRNMVVVNPFAVPVQEPAGADAAKRR